MKCDLKKIYEDLANNVFNSTNENNEFVFSAQVLPIPLIHMVTNRLFVQRTTHGYNSWFRSDALRFHAHKNTYRYLGLLILSVLFHPNPARVQLDLIHPASDIKRLIVDFEYTGLDNRYPGYNTRPDSFRFSPREMMRHPWHYNHPNPYDLPCFWLTNKDDLVIREEEWESRDTVVGFGSDEGSVRFADLLLNASYPQHSENEYVLEGEAGFRGVGKLSAEATLLLPGSVAWMPEQWSSG